MPSTDVALRTSVFRMSRGKAAGTDSSAVEKAT